jgi:hypothetical protein
LHEVFPGNGRRIICIEYNIQIPVCLKCHNVCHGHTVPEHYCRLNGWSQQEIQMRYCQEAGIDYDKVRFEIFNCVNREYLESVSSRCKLKLLEWNYDDYEMSQMQKNNW